MRGRTVFGFCAGGLVVLAIAACSSESKPPPGGSPTTFQPGGTGGGGSGGPEGGVDGAPGDGGGACNTILSTGLLVDVQNVIGDPPPQTGGVITAGDYDITTVTVYVGTTGVGGPSGFTWQGSIHIAGQVLDRVVVEKNGSTGAEDDIRDTSTILAPDAGTSAQISQTCPSLGAAVTSPFTATATTLTVVDPITKTVVVYTHR